uniref:Uncharacterized protein n=1 Tax=Cyprinus carpio TaxID=7962 RepID=A0A8C1LS82_CYPCA
SSFRIHPTEIADFIKYNCTFITLFSFLLNITEKAKVFSLYSGNANALHKVHKTFIGTLQNQIVNLREVGTVDESDIILIFCPIVSRAGTDIDSALIKFKANTGSKQAVLVVLHHTFDPEKIVPDSSRCVNRTDILTVDCLFNEDTGLLDCQKNSDAYDKVVNWLIQQGSKTVSTLNPLQEQGQEKQHKSKKDEGESESRQIKRVKMENDEPKTKVVKVFSISPGKINECDQKFIGILGNRIENLKVVHTEDESDIILVFCPIVSRAGTDIEAALKLKGCTDSEQSQKLTVLVVFHHTFDPEKIVPDSSRCVNRTDVLTVDCLFYEDTGLLECQKNSDAYDKVVNWLIQQGEKTGVNIRPCGSRFFFFLINK